MNSFTCGFLFLLPVLSHASFRIVGGKFANITDCPYQVGLLNRAADELCGGIILNTNTLLTAAHCFKKYPTANQVLISVGRREYKPSNTYPVKNYTVHPKYNATSLIYDVAIIKLSKKLTFSNSVQAAILPKKDDKVTTGTEGLVCGWGYTHPYINKASPFLKSAKIKVLDLKICEGTINKNGQLRIVPETVFCTAGNNYQDSACFGDSGGAFTTGNKQLRGVVSWGFACGKRRLPVIFSKVAFFLDFINKHL